MMEIVSKDFENIEKKEKLHESKKIKNFLLVSNKEFEKAHLLTSYSKFQREKTKIMFSKEIEELYSI